MNSSIKGMWQLIQNSKLSRGLMIGTLLLSIFETLIGLGVPLMVE